MIYSKFIWFKNWTNKDFTCTFDSQTTTFKAGKTYQMPAEMALHYAKHLAVRELYTSGNPADESLPQLKFDKFIANALVGTNTRTMETVLPIEEVQEPTTSINPNENQMAIAEEKVPENKTESDRQNEPEEEEEEVRDNKPPKIKGRPKKINPGDQYVS